MEDRYLTAAIIALGKHICDLKDRLRLAQSDADKWKGKYEALKEETRIYEGGSHDA